MLGDSSRGVTQKPLDRGTSGAFGALLLTTSTWQPKAAPGSIPLIGLHPITLRLGGLSFPHAIVAESSVLGAGGNWATAKCCRSSPLPSRKGPWCPPRFVGGNLHSLGGALSRHDSGATDFGPGQATTRRRQHAGTATRVMSSLSVPDSL